MLLVPRNNSYPNYELRTIHVHGYFIRQNVQICNFLLQRTHFDLRMFHSLERLLVRTRIQCEIRLRVGYELDYRV